MEENEIIEGLIVKSHKTTRRADKDPIFKVSMKSRNQKIGLSIELPDLGRQIFQLYPLGEVVEISIRQPSQITLDRFKEDVEED